jgi:hypothetical protein
MGDRPIARPLPTQNTNTEETQTYIHVLTGIQTHDPRVGGSEDSTFLLERPDSAVKWRKHRNTDKCPRSRRLSAAKY